MSERQPNPEQEKREPLMETCENCGFTYEHTDDNSYLLQFNKMPDADSVVCKCPQCHTKALYFLDEAWKKHALANGIPIELEDDFPPDAVYQMMLSARGIELVEEMEISPRHEEIIRKFGETLTAMTNIDPDGFWEYMNSPQDRPYPTRWI